MATRNFMEMSQEQWRQNKFVCVGLDVEISKIPECVQTRCEMSRVFAFNEAIIDYTMDFAGCYKPNFGFYEGLGHDGILDHKEGDIGNTNIPYVMAAFEYFGADAVTIHPYLGQKAMQPFLDQKDKGIIVLCRTSNPGAGEFQDLIIIAADAPKPAIPLYQYVAHRVCNYWNKNGNCLLVVGATYPEELGCVREMVGDMPILIPGIGAQGGDIQKTITNGKDSQGKGMIINSSRGIIYASNGPDFVDAARRETQKLHNAINQYR